MNISLRQTLSRVALPLLLAGAASFAGAQPAGGAPAGMHGRGMHGGGMAMSGRLLDSVGATADQKTRIQAIMKQAHDDLQAQRQAGRALHEQMATLLAAPTVDTSAVEAVRQKLLAQHDAASRRMMQAMLDAGAVLTPDQRAKIAEKMKQHRGMMERHLRERQGMDGAPKS